MFFDNCMTKSRCPKDFLSSKMGRWRRLLQDLLFPPCASKEGPSRQEIHVSILHLCDSDHQGTAGEAELWTLDGDIGNLPAGHENGLLLAILSPLAVAEGLEHPPGIGERFYGV
jgi:hypothetical protein